MQTTADIAAARSRFAALHREGCFLLANAWDVGSARILQSLGVAAIATTSSGHAASLGRMDQQVSLAELLGHARDLVRAVSVPVSVDAEHCFANDPEGVARTVAAVAETGAAGLSLEDYHPQRGIEPLEAAVEKVVAAAAVAHAHGMVLTARAENHLYGVDDLDDTARRLVAYRDAGADVVYAPGLVDLESISRLVEETRHPLNVLLRPQGPSVGELAAVGVRRVSTGGALAFAAYGALVAAARELIEAGTSHYAVRGLSPAERATAFSP